jgi:integrase
MQSQRRRPTPGIEPLHRAKCKSRDADGVCNCTPSWRASVWSPRDDAKIRRTFRTQAEAKSWRAAKLVDRDRGKLRVQTRTTLREAADTWLDGADAGTILARGNTPYKPSVLRDYRSILERRLLREFGGSKLADITIIDLQDYAARLGTEGLSPSTIRNTMMPLRVIFGRAVSRMELTVNPTTGLKLPAVKGRRLRVAPPTEAAALIAAVPVCDRAVWATAAYAGLRAGELQALRWEDVNLAATAIRVERNFDPKARLFVEPKSAAGRRTVPMPSLLRQFLVDHKLETGRERGLVFGDGTRPFTTQNLYRRAATAWKTVNAKRAEREEEPLEPLSLHDLRHTYASFAIAAGANVKALSTYMGHSSITVTLDRYGHLFPGNELEFAGLLEAFLLGATQTDPVLKAVV